jgi:hypothetical protein
MNQEQLTATTDKFFNDIFPVASVNRVTGACLLLADFVAEVGFEGRIGRPVDFFETAAFGSPARSGCSDAL